MATTSPSTGTQKISFCVKTGLVGAGMAGALGVSGLIAPANAALFGSIVGLSTEFVYRDYVLHDMSSYSELFLAGLKGAAVFYLGSNLLSLDATAMSTVLAEGFLTGYIHYNNMKSTV